MTRPQQSPSVENPAANWRHDFPALQQDVNDHRLVYLDSAASAQQPSAVIDAVANYHRYNHANVHRGVHTLSYRATDAFEGARDKIREFINAGSRSEIILTSGTTESVNLDRCTPSGPPPNQPPTAVAGPDQTVVDADHSGAEVVTLDGSGSSDPGRRIILSTSVMCASSSCTILRAYSSR